MKQQEMIVVGLATVALVLIIKSTAGKSTTQTQSAAKYKEPFRMKGDGSTGNWFNDFSYASNPDFMKLIGL